MHRVHAGFSFVCAVDADAVDKANAVLARMKGNVDAVYRKSKSTHFLTASVLPEQWRGKRRLPPTLLFLTSYWGPTQQHLEELVDHAEADLRELFSHCVRKPGEGRAGLIAYMKRHRRPDTFYSGMHHVTHQEVLDDQTLRREIEKHVDANHGAFVGLTADQAREKIQAFVRGRPDLLAISEPRLPTKWETLVLYRHVIALFAMLAVVVGLIIAAVVTKSRTLDIAAWAGGGVALVFIGGLLLLFALMGLYEWRHDGKTVDRPADDFVRTREDTQLNPVINEFTVAGPIKHGLFRPLFLRMLLWVVTRYVIAKGVKIKTVAAARWLAIDGGRRLIFVSNYTNMAEGYVRDFIDTVSGAGNINLVFSWGIGYPKTRFTYWHGARKDSNGFIHIVHDQMKLTGLWYCPYRDISIDNIRINRAFREGLFGERSGAQVQEWLRKL